MLEILVQRFDSHMPSNGNDSTSSGVVRERVLQFIMRWMQARDDFSSDDSLGVLLVDFISATLEKSASQRETRLLTELFNAFKAKISASLEINAAPASVDAADGAQEDESGDDESDDDGTSKKSKKKDKRKKEKESKKKQKEEQKKKKKEKEKEEAPPIPFLPINMSYR